MTSYLVEPDLTERETAWIDEQIANGRFASRSAAIVQLLGRGLEAESTLAKYIDDPASSTQAMRRPLIERAVLKTT